MSSGKTSALDGSPAKSTRSRKKDTISLDENGNAEVVVVKEVKEINASVKLAGYLNLM